eukprot:gene11818-13042_t
MSLSCRKTRLDLDDRAKIYCPGIERSKFFPESSLQAEDELKMADHESHFIDNFHGGINVIPCCHTYGMLCRLSCEFFEDDRYLDRIFHAVTLTECYAVSYVNFSEDDGYLDRLFHAVTLTECYAVCHYDDGIIVNFFVCMLFHAVTLTGSYAGCDVNFSKNDDYFDRPMIEEEC